MVGVARLPDLEAVGLARALAVVVEVRVARGEVVLLLEQRVVRDVHLVVHAEDGAVGVDDHRGVHVEPGGAAHEDGHHDHHRELPGERLEAVGDGPRHRLRQVEVLDARRLGEVRRVEQLLEADDLRAAARGLADELDRARDVRRGVVGRVVLDDADGERVAAHGAGM
jgi:hypothetical protein